MDHRQGRRIRLLSLADVQPHDGIMMCGLIHNISIDGMELVTDIALEVNSCVDVYIQASDKKNDVIKLPCMVVRKSKHCIGVIFRSLDKNAKRFINTVIKRAVA